MQKRLVGLMLIGFSAGVLAADEFAFLQDTMSDTAISTGMQIMVVMTILTILPGIVLAMTSFTRIIIVLALARQALGLQTTPNNQILIGISIFLTFFIMSPVFDEMNKEALQPYLNHQMDAKTAFTTAALPIKKFMILHTRETDLNLFQTLGDKAPIEEKHAMSPDEVKKNYEAAGLHEIIPAFLTSELKTAFEIGFMIFIPFLIIDLVVASILMTMGMMMLSPLVISLPFKLLLFVMADGWHLLFGSLVKSFE